MRKLCYFLPCRWWFAVFAGLLINPAPIPVAHTATVDGNYDENLQGASDGSLDHPYPTVGRGLAGTPTAGQLILRSGIYPESCQLPRKITQPVQLTSVGGSSVIGWPPGHQRICTTRITQLTGGYDPEGKPGSNDTPFWNVAGTDLGANTEHNGKLFFFFGDVVPRIPTDLNPRDSDLVAYTTDQLAEPSGLRLTPVLQGIDYYPFTVHFPIHSPDVPDKPPEFFRPPTDDTPTGAFSYGGRVYVFFNWHEVWKPDPRPFHSSLAWSATPDQPTPFEYLSDVSTRLAQVVPWVVKNSEIAGLPSDSGDGLILFGQSGDGTNRGWGNQYAGVFLAWMPLHPVMGPETDHVWYWTNAQDPAQRWSLFDGDAKPLFATRWDWSSLSVGRIPQTGQWILLYQRAFRAKNAGEPEAPEESIVARISSTPWGFLDATENGEIELFNPVRDGAYQVRAGDGTILRRGFMYRERSPFPDGLDHLEPQIGGKSFAYGAYLLNRYTRYEAGSRILTIYYLMSTATPYQVQLMKSEIRLAK